MIGNQLFIEQVEVRITPPPPVDSEHTGSGVGLGTGSGVGLETGSGVGLGTGSGVGLGTGCGVGLGIGPKCEGVGSGDGGLNGHHQGLVGVGVKTGISSQSNAPVG